jgi:AraC-like DNA-binding protein
LGSLESQAHTQLKLLSQLESTSEKVAMLVGAQLNQGLPKRALIAAQLNMSEKTLQRRLKAQKTHYLAVLDKVRLARVEELLNLPGLSLVQISQLSGFTAGLSKSPDIRRAIAKKKMLESKQLI